MRRVLLKLAGCVVVAASLDVAGVAQNRLPQLVVGDAARVAVRGSIDPRAKTASVLGAAPGDRKLETLSLRFNMTAAQTAALDSLLAAQQNPASSLFHKWLTPEQFGEQFGLGASDLATVSTWLESQGFTVDDVARGRTFISFSGTVAQVNRAFGVSLQRVSRNGETHVANLTEPMLPASIAGVVRAVTGLNDFRLHPRSRVRSVATTNPDFTSAVSGNHFLAPGDLYTIYDMNGLLGQGINGTGVSIAVLGQVAISTADVGAFRSASSLSTTNLPATTTYGAAPQAPTKTGTNGSPTFEDLDESQLDVEWSGAAAPGASILFVNGVDVFGNAMTGAIDHNLAPILTVSYGGCEAQFGTAAEAELSTLFKQANSQGQTILGPSADTGATDCDYKATTATQGLSVDFPASSPYVTGVGGTSFLEGGGTYWDQANGNYAGSALSYVPEQNWNESFLTSASCGGTMGLCGLSSGGGGASFLYPKPVWQIGTGVPEDASRDVPDISFNGDADHDGYLFCAQGSCVNGFRDASQSLSIVGGTSVSTPVFAGMLAMLEQKLQTSLGNVNPTIYGLASSPYASTVFHDVTSGNNASPCTLGTIGCSAGDPHFFAANTLSYPAYAGVTGPVPYPAIGYTANAGYDLVSGWGSLDVGNMVADWNLVTPAGTTSAAAASTTTLLSSSGNIAAGTPLVFSVTVSSGGGSARAVPTGSVQLAVDGSATGAVVTLANGSAAFPAFSTASLSSGSHIFTATYTGDGNYSASKGSVTVDVTSATAADFTLTPAMATATTVSGSTASGITLTLTPVGGFTGTVTLTATTNSPSLSANYNFSLDPVTLTASGAQTTVLTIQAFGSQFKNGAGQLRRRAAQVQNHRAGPWGVAGSGLALAALLMLGGPKFRRRMPGLVLIALLALGTLVVSGCGNKTIAANSTLVNAAPGTYTITVVATGVNAAGSTLTHNTIVTFVVQ